jgi:hypothetical protein
MAGSSTWNAHAAAVRATIMYKKGDLKTMIALVK